MKKDGLCRVCGCQKNFQEWSVSPCGESGRLLVGYETDGRYDDFQMKLNFNLKVPLYACAIEADESLLSMCLVGWQYTLWLLLRSCSLSKIITLPFKSTEDCPATPLWCHVWFSLIRRPTRHMKKPVWILSGEKSIRNFTHCNKWPLLVLGPTWIENRPYFDQLKHCQNTTLCDKKKERVKYYTMDPYLTKTNWSRDMHIFQRTKCVESITFWNPLKRQICMVNLDSKRAWSMPDKFQFDMTGHITNGSRSWKWMVG